MQIIDADGHINDHACGEEIAAHMPKGNQMAKPFPEFDHLHFRYLKQNRRATGNPSPRIGISFSTRPKSVGRFFIRRPASRSEESWRRNGRCWHAKPITPGSMKNF